MVINFVGLFSITGSGEISDETHLARELEARGHTVRKIPRDEWREFVIEGYPQGKYPNIPEDLKADINIIIKWPHFYDGKFIISLRELSRSPVFYWSFDSIDLNIDWHREMAIAADLYLSGELGRAAQFHQLGINHYYLQFDCVDRDVPIGTSTNKVFDVTYLGTYDNQNGRMDLLKEINKEIPIKVWGQNYEEWRNQGFDAKPAVYGLEANKVIAQSKINLGTSCDPNMYGYWSNRVGRVIYAGGFLLQQYTPGMEIMLGTTVNYFQDAEEAIERIKGWLTQDTYREISVAANNQSIRYKYSSRYKVMQLETLIIRYLKSNKGKDWQLG